MKGEGLPSPERPRLRWLLEDGGRDTTGIWIALIGAFSLAGLAVVLGWESEGEEGFSAEGEYQGCEIKLLLTILPRSGCPMEAAIGLDHHVYPAQYCHWQGGY